MDPATVTAICTAFLVAIGIQRYYPDARGAYIAKDSTSAAPHAQRFRNGLRMSQIR